ncbi:BnaA06g34620D [Brassica napus]|uniref:BnaA06g34620D protein n=1 Tax=Brassica napus TaxID=3708 RepID=A0A078FZ97_BRANA|nr:BnaA06g34620D [Brassica napus]
MSPGEDNITRISIEPEKQSLLEHHAEKKKKKKKKKKKIMPRNTSPLERSFVTSSSAFLTV